MSNRRYPNLKPGDEWLAEYVELIFAELARLNGGDTTTRGQKTGRILKTPSGGIPAIAGSVPGKATCDLYRLRRSDGTLEDTLLDVEVYNMAKAVGGSRFIQAKLVDGVWFADVEACP